MFFKLIDIVSLIKQKKSFNNSFIDFSKKDLLK